MRPVIVGIGGAYSGAGKTTIASLVLKNLKGWGAIKYTKTSLYSSITDNIEILSQPGKDTNRLLDSGAEKVLWVQAPYSGLIDILPAAVEMLSHLRGIVVEGNSAVEVLNPDIVVFVSASAKKYKAGADKILSAADVVVFDNKPPLKTPKAAKVFSLANMEGCAKFIKGLIEKYEDNRKND